MDNQSRLRQLLDAYTGNTIDENGFDELCVLLRASDDQELREIIAGDLRKEPLRTMRKEKLERMLAAVWGGVKKDENDVERKVVPMWRKLAVAAAVVGILFSVYIFMNRESVVRGPSSVVTQTDVQAPDKNRAQIKLSDGTLVYLDSAGNGELAMQGNVKLVKNANGEIEYNRESSIVSGEVQYNTLYNPRGSKVQPLLLDDGTKVWLNAESSITYPTAFVSNERKVEITGEAYFEVAKNASKKFYVTGAGVTTEVLGTHFNVNTFKDEGVVRVTLLEGSVKTSVGPSTGSGSESSILKPGEQAQVGSGIKVVNSIDIEEVMAWKNGLFQFNRTNIVTIMRQVERWYDVEVVFEQNDLKEKDFTGGIGRAENVSEVLKMLERTGVLHFKVEGRKIIVSR